MIHYIYITIKHTATIVGEITGKKKPVKERHSRKSNTMHFKRTPERKCEQTFIKKE